MIFRVSEPRTQRSKRRSTAYSAPRRARLGPHASGRPAAPLLLLGDLLDSQAQRRRAHPQLAVLGELAHLMEAAQHQLLQLLIDLVLAPQKLLDVLHPLEIRH